MPREVFFSSDDISRYILALLSACCQRKPSEAETPSSLFGTMKECVESHKTTDSKNGRLLVSVKIRLLWRFQDP